MTKRQQRIRTVIIGVVIAGMLALGFILLTREKAGADANWVAQGNAELLDPQGFYRPYSQLQLGRNCYENIIHGTAYTVPSSCGQEDIISAMLEYHALRQAHFSYVFSDGRACLTHDEAMCQVKEGQRTGIDLRVFIPIMEFESSMNANSGNVYGFRGGGPGGNFEAQTAYAFDAALRWAGGNDPYRIYYEWHSNGPEPYVTNCLNTYRGCDGGDLQ